MTRRDLNAIWFCVLLIWIGQISDCIFDKRLEHRVEQLEAEKGTRP